MTSKNMQQSNTCSKVSLLNPRRSLKAKVGITVISLILVSTCFCSYLTMHIAQSVLQSALERDANMVTHTASEMVSQQFATGKADQIGDSLNQMIFDSRVAFIVITDTNKHTLARNIADPEAWYLYTTKLTDGHPARTFSANTTIILTDNNGVDLLVQKQPLWQNISDDPNHSSRPELNENTGKIYGYIELALRDPKTRIMQNNIRTATIGTVCVVMLVCLPLVMLVTDKWARPLRKLVDATKHLQMNKLPTPIKINNKDEIGLLTNAFNTMATNLFNIHRELERANQHLEDKVKQRTSELEQANRHLQQDMDDKDEFIRAISHDLNAPLRNIAGMTKTLLAKYDEQFTDDALSKLQRIAANTKAETELLNDLLELSRIKSKPGKIQSVDLDKQIQQLTETFSYDLEQKDITLIIDTQLPAVTANRNRIRQVFQNLIDNAIKYMPENAAIKEIHIGVEDRKGQNIFYVRDTGIGIADNDKTRVFQIFQRARYSNNTDIPGRGVGLATVKSIIESYGGYIWLKSEPSQGTVFFFTLETNHLRYDIKAAKTTVTTTPIIQTSHL